jgi:hypothetical protein
VCGVRAENGNESGENETAKRTSTVESVDYRVDLVVIVLVLPKGIRTRPTTRGHELKLKMISGLFIPLVENTQPNAGFRIVSLTAMYGL